MNDLINNVLDRYKSFKKGDRSASAEINPAFVKNGSSKSKSATKAAPAPNLIDFDEPAPATSSNGGAPNSSNPMDDEFGLGGLTLGGMSSAPSANNSVGASANGGGLLDGLDFGLSPAPQQQQQLQQQQQPQSAFYQQYQTTQQPTVSWGNLSAQPGARSPSPMNTNTYGQNNTMMPQSSASLSANKMTSPTSTGHNSLRPTTPGAINLGMMGAVPPPSPLGQGQNRQATPSSSYQPPHQQQQQSISQTPRLKDPFDDLLNF